MKDFIRRGKEILAASPRTTGDMAQNLSDTEKLISESMGALKTKKEISELADLLQDVSGHSFLCEEHNQVVQEWDAFVSELQNRGDLVQHKRNAFFQELDQKVVLRFAPTGSQFCSRWHLCVRN